MFKTKLICRIIHKKLQTQNDRLVSLSDNSHLQHLECFKNFLQQFIADSSVSSYTRLMEWEMSIICGV